MLYSNRPREVRTKLQDWGHMSYIAVGGNGLKGKTFKYRVVVDNCIKVISEGYNPCTIGRSKRGLPKIVEKGTDKVYMILSSDGGENTGLRGFIQASGARVLTSGSGSHGTCVYDDILLEADPGCVVRVRYSGTSGDEDFYLVDNGCVESLTALEYAVLSEGMVTL